MILRSLNLPNLCPFHWAIGALFVLAPQLLSAQCTADYAFDPDVSFATSPDPLLGESFADGEIGQPYSDVWHVLLPSSAEELVGFPLTIDSVVVEAFQLMDVEGELYLPEDIGLSFSPNNNGDSPNPNALLGGQQYCADLTGTPDTVGLFIVSVNVFAWSNFIGTPTSSPYSLEGYTLTINPPPGPGCTDPDACNYATNATSDDGSCVYNDAAGVCGGSCIEDADADGICDDVDECIGTFDACGVCNGPGPVNDCGCTDIPPGQCDCSGNVVDAIGICGGACAADENQNGICDTDEVYGCIYPFAINYNSVSLIDDGSCLLGGCTDPSAPNYLPSASVDDGSCITEPCEEEGTSYLGDLNNDGVVGAGDLLVMLSVFGVAYE